MAEESRGCKGRPQLLDQWSVQESSSGKRGEDWSAAQEKVRNTVLSLPSLRHVARTPETTNANGSSGSKKGPRVPMSRKQMEHKQIKRLSNNSSSSNLGSSSCRQKERTAYRGQVGALSGRASGRMAVGCELHAAVAAAALSQGSGRSILRAASAPAVGWPPIRSFRKNLTGGVKSLLNLPVGAQRL
ncbi:hypothetical protein C4D60_Mb10t09200 [Musa balbisiana]|uniref:Auxin-responsive protein n=1 Tax=Musa balbisiana TaxID=52838 RepID=A0A4S8IVU8_MUSBA|nr:hypothetical protein C4D60_Mb10t09200 [Musa balbisiana]